MRIEIQSRRQTDSQPNGIDWGHGSVHFLHDLSRLLERADEVQVAWMGI